MLSQKFRLIEHNIAFGSFSLLPFSLTETEKSHFKFIVLQSYTTRRTSSIKLRIYMYSQQV